MDSRILVHIGITRMRLPVPTAKLSVARHAARLLESSEYRDEVWETLLEWIANLEFESEVAEALVIPLLAKCSEIVSAPRLRHVIAKPSALSALLIDKISGTQALINTWINAHSGEVPPFFSGRDIIPELTSSQVVPHRFSTRLEYLEQKSGKPFVRQWAFEYSRLEDIYGEQWDGDREQFCYVDRNRNAGQFITRRGHVARSAYLRALALAVDKWGMPENLALTEALYATPVDFCFLRMAPGNIPGWTDALLGNTPLNENEWKALVVAVNERLSKDRYSALLYLNCPVALTEDYKADLEIATFLHQTNIPLDPNEPWILHWWLPGHHELERTKADDIEIRNRGELLFPTKAAGNLAPGVLPGVVRHVGYMHAELFGRMPYLPASYSREEPLYAEPYEGGMHIRLGGRDVGVVEHWNYRWTPTHDKSLGPHCGVATRMSPGAVDENLSIPGMTLRSCWRARVVSREKEYGEWTERTFSGSLP